MDLWRALIDEEEPVAQAPAGRTAIPNRQPAES